MYWSSADATPLIVITIASAGPRRPTFSMLKHRDEAAQCRPACSSARRDNGVQEVGRTHQTGYAHHTKWQRRGGCGCTGQRSLEQTPGGQRSDQKAAVLEDR